MSASTLLAQAELWAAECRAAHDADPKDAATAELWLDALADLRRVRSEIVAAALAGHTTSAPTA
ncbi:hypothetical protein ACWGB8_01630 [Kitasatospora sp. NPDC054939]